MGLFSWIPGVGDTIDGLIDNLTGKRQNDLQDQALTLEQQKMEFERQRADQLKQIFGQAWDTVQKARLHGDFDPNKRVEAFTTRFNANAKEQQQNLGAGLAAAGYQPTDSEVKYRTDRLGRAQVHDMAVGQQQAASSALSDELGAIRATDPSLITQSGALFGSGTDSAANMSAAFGSQGGSGLGNLLGAILPFVGKKPGPSGWGSKLGQGDSWNDYGYQNA